jgi:hypothetical protein
MTTAASCHRCGDQVTSYGDTPWFGTNTIVEGYNVRTTFYVSLRPPSRVWGRPQPDAPVDALLCPKCCQDLIGKALAELRPERLRDDAPRSVDVFDEPG